MKHLFSLVAVAAITISASAQTLYNTGGTLYVGAGATLYVSGDLTNDATATINNNGILNITGNTVNNGTVSSPNGSNISFSGTSAQTVSGSATVIAEDVLVNNSAGVTLNTPLSVDGAMTFTSGIITAASSSAPVIFTANGTVSGTPTNASHINGYVQKQGTGAFTFPIGNATNYQPVAVNLSANSAAMTARYIAADGGGGTSAPLLYVNRREYWDLSPTGTASGTVTIYFDGYNNSGIGNTSDLRVAHKSGSTWVSEGAASTTGTTASGTATSTSVSSWSPFTLGSVSSASPLPLTLSAFSARAQGVANRIDWQTTSEQGISGFELQRSADGADFSILGNVSAKGSASSYSLNDEQAPAGKAYYRLRSKGADGESYSKVVAVSRSAAGSAISLNAYPNPATDKLTIEVSNAAAAGSISLKDISGRVLRNVTVSNVAAVMELNGIPAGIYLAVYQDGMTTEVIRVMKQ